MDTVLESIFPYEGIPEVILDFFPIEEIHLNGSPKLKAELEKKYQTVVMGINYFNGKLNNWNQEIGFSTVTSTDQTEREEIVWERYGKVHRELDLPAKEYTLHYAFTDSYFGGLLAQQTNICDCTCQVWYRDGQVHRDGDKPAVISESISISHRGNESYTSKSTRREWHKNGKLHRVGGPAIFIRKTNPDEEIGEWWFDGVKQK